MKLSEYLLRENLSQAKFARRIGLTQASVCRLIKHNSCWPATAARIFAVTGGAVQVQGQPREANFGGYKTPANLDRHRRIVSAKQDGVSNTDLSERFGCKNASRLVWYSRKMINRAYTE